jgi:DNA repair protein RadA/Sms
MALVFVCSGRDRGVCDHEAPQRWTGRCPSCQRFYSIKVKGNDDVSREKSSLAVIGLQEKKYIPSGMPEFDKVIGGGFVAGAPYIISGPPGAGKSTLLLTICNLFANEKRPVLYASGEERREDIGALANRIGALSSSVEVLGNQGNMYEITERAEEMKAKLVIIDSLNTAYLSDTESAEGSSQQMKDVANYFTAWCKREDVPAIIVAHVDKSGELSGPKAAEHLVDVILELDRVEEVDEDGEVDPETAGLIMFSCAKNRHGASGVSSYFKVTPTGVVPVRKKSKLSLV